MKRLSLAATMALLSAWMAQPISGQGSQTADYALSFNVSATTFVYPRVTGVNKSPFGDWIQNLDTATTSGSSTTVTSATTTGFAAVAVDDPIVFSTSPPSHRVIAAKASDQSITIDTAINLATATKFVHKKTAVGATDSDGWIDVSGGSSRQWGVSYNQGDLGGGLDFKIECRLLDGTSYWNPIFQVYPSSGVANFASPGSAIGTVVVAFEHYSECRVGLKANTSDPSDAGANREQVTVRVLE